MRTTLAAAAVLAGCWAQVSLAEEQLLGVSPPRSAAPARPETEDWWPRRASLSWENDLFGGTDRHYTNGLELALFGSIPPEAFPAYLDGHQSEWRLTLAQSIYTPERLEEHDVIPGDRAYAGWLRLGVSLQRRSASLPYTDRLGLEIGGLGPSSGAGTTHTFFHEKVTGSSLPQGWANQLRSELGLSLTYDCSLRIWRLEFFGLDLELEPMAGLSLGNVLTQASAGATLRIGDVPDVYSSRGGEGPFVFLSFGGDGRFVAHDVFLDGSLFRPGGHSVPTRRFVADLRAGFSVQITGGLSFSYTHSYRTAEFRGQSGGNQIGSLKMAFSW